MASHWQQSEGMNTLERLDRYVDDVVEAADERSTGKNS